MKESINIEEIIEEVDNLFSPLERWIGCASTSCFIKNYKCVFGIEGGDYIESLQYIGIAFLLFSPIILILIFVIDFWVSIITFSTICVFACIFEYLRIQTNGNWIEKSNKIIALLLPKLKENFILLKTMELDSNKSFERKFLNILKDISWEDTNHGSMNFYSTLEREKLYSSNSPDSSIFNYFVNMIPELEKFNNNLEQKVLHGESSLSGIENNIKNSLYSLAKQKETLTYLYSKNIEEPLISSQIEMIKESYIKEKNKLNILELKKDKYYPNSTSLSGKRVQDIGEIIEECIKNKYKFIAEDSKRKIEAGLKLINEAQYSVKPILPYKEQLKMQSQIEINKVPQQFISQS